MLVHPTGMLRLAGNTPRADSFERGTLLKCGGDGGDAKLGRSCRHQNLAAFRLDVRVQLFRDVKYIEGA